MMFEFDALVNQFCEERSIAYTRYADDLTFSGASIDAVLPVRATLQKWVDEITAPQLTINWSKFVIITKKAQRRITGVVVTNDGQISLGRRRKRELRATLDYYRNGRLDKRDVEILRGWLAFANSVEPEFMERMKSTYGETLMASLMGRKFTSFYTPPIAPPPF